VPPALLLCAALGGWKSNAAGTLSPAPLVSSDTTLVLLGGHYARAKQGESRGISLAHPGHRPLF